MVIIIKKIFEIELLKEINKNTKPFIIQHILLSIAHEFYEKNKRCGVCGKYLSKNEIEHNSVTDIKKPIDRDTWYRCDKCEKRWLLDLMIEPKYYYKG